MENNKKDKRLFKSYRWHEDVGAKVVGYKKSSKEEREESKKQLDKILRDRGIK